MSVAFLDESGLPHAGPTPPTGYRSVGLSGLGLINIEHLLSPEQQAQLAAKRAADAAAAAERAALAPQVVVVPSTPCDGASQAAAAATARARGGCVDVTVCDNAGRVAATNRQCWDDPVVKAGLIQQIKSDEIEAGALERMVEMASATGANAHESVQRALAEAGALASEVADFSAQAVQDEADMASTRRARDRLANLAAAARSRAGVRS